MADPRVFTAAELLRLASRGDCLTEWDRERVGARAARLQIPLEDVIALRKHGKALSALGAELQALTELPLPADEILLSARIKIGMANKSIRKIGIMSKRSKSADESTSRSR